jgi:formiminotetrahydrofolate cyclodeaminase
VLLLMAGLRGAALNVEVNLRSVSDASFGERVSQERDQLVADAEADAATAAARLTPRR